MSYDKRGLVVWYKKLHFSIDFLKKHYPDGDYLAVYESGFSGFSTYYALKEVGIECMIIHAADVPTTQYEEVMKSDKIDSVKLVRSLKAGLLKGIYIREKENIDDRSVVRIRKTIQKQLSGYKSRVKHMLHCNGVEIPERFERPGSMWSKVFIRWLKEDVQLLSSTRNSLDLLIRQVETIRMALLEATKVIRSLSQTERYRRKFDLLITVPGIGISVSMCILTEVYDIKRFHNEREFAATPIFKGIPDFRQTRIAMLRAETMSDLLTILEATRKRLG